jgi:nicotinate-nucleotide adenylyltransferase
MKTGLFFGSFNPIHVGHLVIAEYMLEFTDLQEIWFVVSPQNPLKNADELAPDHHRMEMVQLAIPLNTKGLKACGIEMELPRPSYTIDTLRELSRIYPNTEFVVVMGSDSIETIEKWKDYLAILNSYEVYVYPRRNGYRITNINHPNITLIDAPVINISSTMVRHFLSHGEDVSGFVPEDVWEYIDRHKVYRATH